MLECSEYEKILHRLYLAIILAIDSFLLGLFLAARASAVTDVEDTEDLFIGNMISWNFFLVVQKNTLSTFGDNQEPTILQSVPLEVTLNTFLSSLREEKQVR